MEEDRRTWVNFKVRHVHTCQQICCNKSWPRKECGDDDDVEFFWCPVILRLRDRVHFHLQVPSMSPPIAWEVLIWCREAVPFNALNDSTLNVQLLVCVACKLKLCWKVVVHVEQFYRNWVINFDFALFSILVLRSFGRDLLNEWVHKELSKFIFGFVRNVQNPVKWRRLEHWSFADLHQDIIIHQIMLILK